MEASDCYRQADLFESMRLGMKVKMAITRENPDMALFTLRAFYETDPISGRIFRKLSVAFQLEGNAYADESESGTVPGRD